MKDEIKEIERILATSGKYITYAERCYVLDYITNLQEENKRLKELDENYPIEEQLEEALKWKNIYKSRIDKANEYIEKNYFITGRIAEIHSILQGSDKDVKD